MEQQKGFFPSLFDFSFTTLITPKLIKLLFGIIMVAAGLAAIFLIIEAFNASITTGVLMLIIGGPLLFLLSALYARVILETVLVLFRISEHTAEIAERGRKGPSD
jgi:RsiW-degrading membrane proteinase PrsW (M82 family)